MASQTFTWIGSASAHTQADTDALLNGLVTEYGWTLLTGPTYAAGPPATDAATYTEGSANTSYTALGVMTVTVVCDPADVTSVPDLRAYVVAALGMGAQSDGTPLRFRMAPTEAPIDLQATVDALTLVPVQGFATIVSGVHTLILRFGTPLTDGALDPAAWTVSLNGGGASAAASAVADGNKVGLELAGTPLTRITQPPQTIAVNYTASGTNDLLDAAGRTVANFASFPVLQRLDQDTFTGDSGSGGVQGLVPAPAAGDAAAGKFLGAGGWAVPAAGDVSRMVASGTSTIAAATSRVVSYGYTISDGATLAIADTGVLAVL